MHLPRTSILSAPSTLRASNLPRGVIPLAVVYFLSSASMFLWIYMPSKMTALGWTGAHIGAFFMVKTISQALATPLWARWANRAPNREPRLVGLQHWIALPAIALLPLATSWTLGVVIAVVLGVTVRSAAPLIDTMALDKVGMGHFGRVRSIGTLGFGLVALAFAGIGSAISQQSLSNIAPWAMLVLTALCIPAIQRLTPSASSSSDSQQETTGGRPGRATLLELVRSPVVLLLFPVAALFVATHAPYTIFLVGLAEERQFGAWLPGVAVFIGIVGEFLAFLTFHKLVRRAPPEWLLGAVVLITGLRWYLTGVTTNAAVFVGLQLLHGLTFAVFFLALLKILHRHWGPKQGANAQALLYLLVFTVGSGVGTLVAGILFDLSSASIVFKQAGVMSFLLLPGLVLALRTLERSTFTLPHRPAQLRPVVLRPVAIQRCQAISGERFNAHFSSRLH